MYIETYVTMFVSTLSHSGTLAENAEQIGHAIKHIGLRPSLVVMSQAVDSFFHFSLPRKYELCGGLIAV